MLKSDLNPPLPLPASTFPFSLEGLIEALSAYWTEIQKLALGIKNLVIARRPMRLAGRGAWRLNHRKTAAAAVSSHWHAGWIGRRNFQETTQHENLTFKWIHQSISSTE
jgi:hypothetical protein